MTNTKKKQEIISQSALSSQHMLKT